MLQLKYKCYIPVLGRGLHILVLDRKQYIAIIPGNARKLLRILEAHWLAHIDDVPYILHSFQ